MFAVFLSGSGVDGFYSILAVSGFYRFARVRAAFAFLLPCAGFGCAPAVLRRVRERGFWVPYGYSRCVPFFFRINPGCGSEGVFPWPGCLFFSVFSRTVFRSWPVVSILCAERKIVRFRLIFRLAETECMIYGIYAGLGACFA